MMESGHGVASSNYAFHFNILEEAFMATIFNESTVAAKPAGNGAVRQQLLTNARVPGSGILLDRLTLERGGEALLAVPATSVAWLQPLDGETLLSQGGQRQTLTDAQTLSDANVAFLPPGFAATISSAGGAALLYGEIPDAGRFDAGFKQNPPPFRLADWTREPVLDS